MRYTAWACSLRSPRNSTLCEPCAPSEARSVALPARSARSALMMPTRSVTSSRSCQRMVETSNPPRSLRSRTTRRPLVAAMSSRRCATAKTRRWIAHASNVSPGISTERSSASGRSASASSKTRGSLILGHSCQRRLWLADDLGAKCAQLRLDGARVGRTHADQQLLPGRAPFEIRIGVLVHHSRLHERNRRGPLRSLQQVIDHLDEPVIEILAGIAQVLVSLLEERIEPPVNERQRLHVGGLHDLHERRVAREIRVAERHDLPLRRDRRLSGCRPDRSQLHRYFLARQVVDGRDDVPHDVLRREKALDRT